MNKKILQITNPNRELHRTVDITSLNKKQIDNLILSECREYDWWYTECEYDDRWPDFRIMYVADEEVLELKKIMLEDEERFDKEQHKREESQEKAEFERLKKKFEK